MPVTLAAQLYAEVRVALLDYGRRVLAPGGRPAHLLVPAAPAGTADPELLDVLRRLAAAVELPDAVEIPVLLALSLRYCSGCDVCLEVTRFPIVVDPYAYVRRSRGPVCRRCVAAGRARMALFPAAA